MENVSTARSRSATRHCSPLRVRRPRGQPTFRHLPCVCQSLAHAQFPFSNAYKWPHACSLTFASPPSRLRARGLGTKYEEQKKMRVGIGADHGGFEMKRELVALLTGEGHEVVDFGNKALDESDDYPDFAI